MLKHVFTGVGAAFRSCGEYVDYLEQKQNRAGPKGKSDLSVEETKDLGKVLHVRVITEIKWETQWHELSEEEKTELRKQGYTYNAKGDAWVSPDGTKVWSNTIPEEIPHEEATLEPADTGASDGVAHVFFDVSEVLTKGVLKGLRQATSWGGKNMDNPDASIRSAASQALSNGKLLKRLEKAGIHELHALSILWNLLDSLDRWAHGESFVENATRTAGGYIATESGAAGGAVLGAIAGERVAPNQYGVGVGALLGTVGGGAAGYFTVDLLADVEWGEE